ncbi:hypothetical protein JOB18_041719 [Solea senegalensis]|uniref:Uncharacterized protein n=1 Tax=Solea senegalensis TaxID=28829 RepID=A0AAV6QIU3_SOLSE|nr:hypothetical protein JOB18_041719 [Solea senegalensis]KAG7490762.1 hypothetical protein JOB18_041719 [Solea senegalensis]
MYEEEQEMEEGAAGHEQQRRRRPIGNQRTMSIFGPTWAKHALRQLPQSLQPGPTHNRERERECQRQRGQEPISVHFPLIQIKVHSLARDGGRPWCGRLVGCLINAPEPWRMDGVMEADRAMYTAKTGPTKGMRMLRD